MNSLKPEKIVFSLPFPKIMKKLLPFVLLIVIFQSCVPANKLYYFHNLKPSVQSIDREKQSSVQKIKQGDRLSINVSVPDAAISSFLNPYRNSSNSSNSLQSWGYLVNKDGNIEFPSLGLVNLLGLATAEAAAVLKKKLEFLYKDPFVTVNIEGRVYLLSGKNGSIVPIVNERLTIFEALVQSSIVNDPYDLKDQLWLIREENNERVFVQLDLSDKAIFESPYYYLRNNDLLYLKPGRFANSFSSNSPVRFIITMTSVVTSFFFLISKIK